MADLPRLVLEDIPEEAADNTGADETLARLLEDMQYLIARNPYAARSLAAAFVAEGQRFAETDEGREWFDVLSRSDAMRRAQLIWETYALDNLLEAAPENVPGIWIDTFAQAATHSDLESILSMLLVRGVNDGAFRTE